MSSNWAEKFTRWRPFHLGSIAYPLTHVHPFRFELLLPAREKQPELRAEVRVAFSSHTFTVRCAAEIAPHEYYSGRNDRRTFDFERYHLSKCLPELIKGLGSRKCYFTRHQNYFVADPKEGLAIDHEYWVFFSIRKSHDGRAAQMFVESAYPGDRRQAPYGRSREKVRFQLLVSKALAGGAPRRPLP